MADFGNGYLSSATIWAAWLIRMDFNAYPRCLSACSNPFIPQPKYATSRYAKAIASFGYVAAINTERKISISFLSSVLSYRRVKVLTNCWSMVLAPDIRPSTIYVNKALVIANRSNPQWVRKFLSSATMSASMRTSDPSTGDLTSALMRSRNRATDSLKTTEANFAMNRRISMRS